TFAIKGENLIAAKSYQITKLYVEINTSAIGADNTYTQGSNFAMGNIVFYPANANGTGYAWGLVTTAANIAPGAGPGLLQINGAVAPTYTVAGRISKFIPFTTAVVTAGAAGANAWTVNSGSYTPLQGDVVLYRNVTDAPTVVNWGVATDATSINQNDFKINGQSLIATKQYQISKIYGVQTSRIDGFTAHFVDNNMSFDEGDLVFAPLANSSITPNYSWAFITGGARTYYKEGDPQPSTAISTLKLNGSATGVNFNNFLYAPPITKLSPTSASVTRSIFIGVGAVGGGGIPEVSAVVPDLGFVNSTVDIIRITGLNTTFSSTSTIQIINPSDQSVISTTSAATNSTIQISNVATTGPTGLSFRAIIGSAVTAGRYHVKITSGNQIAFRDRGFEVKSGSLGAGLTLLAPSGSDAPREPRFSFGHSSATGVNWYRLTVRNTNDFTSAATPMWDYIFPKTGTSKCDAQTCNVPWIDALNYTLTPQSSLSANATYYWRIQTYSLSATSAQSSFTAAVPPVETSNTVSFQTSASFSDSIPPNVAHQQVMGAASGTNLDLIAKVTDNGDPTLIQTKLYYCNGVDCNPTTEAAAPTNLGAGYYKYRIPSATIGVASTVTRYYISAADGSNNTNTSKALTGNNPHTIIAGSAGASSISGTVKESDGSTNGTCSAGIQGATIFALGTGSSATTDGTCAYTLTNIPAGRFALQALKEGYSGPDLKNINAGSTGIAMQLGQGSSGGLGGDITRPHLVFKMPQDNTTIPAGAQTGFRIIAGFDKSMALDNNSVKVSGNFTVQDITTLPATDITSRGSWEYYTTAPAVQGLPSMANIAVWTMSGTNTLGDNKKIAVLVGSSVKDTALNPLEGSTGFTFNTGVSLGTQTFDATTGMFSGGGVHGVGGNMPPQVNSLSVPQGATNVPRNAKVMITFSELMANDAGSSYVLKDYVKLFTVNGSTETDVSTSAIDTVTIDPSARNATINLKGTYSEGLFAVGTKYRVKILGGAKSASGISMRMPGQEQTVAYPMNMGQTDFTTGSSSESGNLSMDTMSFAQNDTGFKTTAPITMTFDRDIDPSTLTTSNISLTAGSTRVEGSFSYDPSTNKATFIPSEALAPNTSYTLTLGTGLKSLNTSAALSTAVTQSFTTGAADTSAPKIMSMRVDDYRIAVFFSKPMNAVANSTDINWATSVLNPATYHSVKYGAAGFNSATEGMAISLTASGVTFSYNAGENRVEIIGLNLRSMIGREVFLSMDIAGTPVGDANISRDVSGNTMSATANSARSRVEDSSNTKGMMGMFSTPSPTMMGMAANYATDQYAYAPTAEAKPAFNALQGQTTVYHVRVPLSAQIPAGGSIVLAFDPTFNVTNAKQDVKSFLMNDLNGPRSGTIRLQCTTGGATKICPAAGGATVTGDSAGAGDATTRGAVADDGIIVENDNTLRVYLSAATEANDILEFDIDGIRSSNVPAKYTINIQPKKADGTSATEPAFSSGEFSIQKLVTGSAYTVSGTITATGNTQAGTAKVYLKAMGSPLGFEATTADFGGTATATYTFSNIPAGSYMLAMPPLVVIGTAKFSGKVQPINVSANTVQNVTLDSNTTGGTNVTVNITSAGLNDADKALDVFAGSTSGGRKEPVTLDGAGAGTVTLNLTNGTWFIGVGPQMPEGFGAQTQRPNYFPPSPISVTVNGAAVTENSGTTPNDGIVAVALQGLSASGKTIKGTVKNPLNNLPMAGIRVNAYSPTNSQFVDTETSANGTFTLPVLEGTYEVWASGKGMGESGRMPATVLATNNLIIPGITTDATGITPNQATTQFVINMKRPLYTITGRVTKDGTETNGLKDVSIHAYRAGDFGGAEIITDSSGDYELFVDSGTWRVGGFVPGYGPLTEQEITVGTQNVSSKNFQMQQTGSSYFSVSGRVYNDTNGNTTYDAGEEEKNAYVNAFLGSFINETQTKDDGTYTINNIPSANGYQVRVTDVNRTELGVLPPFNVAANVTNKDLRVSVRRTVTVTFSRAVSNAGISISDPATGVNAYKYLESGTSVAFSVPDGSYTARIDTKEAQIASTMVTATDGNTTWNNATGAVTVNGNEGLTVAVPTLRTVTGTVTDGTDANNAKDAWVELMNPTTGFHRGVQASNGTFTLQAPDAASTYRIEAKKYGLFSESGNLTINGANPSAQALTATASGASIEGRVTAGGNNGSYAYVIAERQGGGIVKTDADGSGYYKIPLTAGSWRVRAGVDGYQEKAYGTTATDTRGTLVIVSSNSDAVAGKDIALTTTRAMAAPFSKPFDRTAGGTMRNMTTGSGVIFPANTLPKGNDTVKVDMTEKVASPTNTATPVAGKGIEYTAKDTNDKDITTFDNVVDIEQCYTPAELSGTRSATDSSIDTLTEANTLKLAYENKGTWEVLSGSSMIYKDGGDVEVAPTPTLSNVAKACVKAPTKHFSLYAAIVATDPNAPTPPTGLAAGGATGTSLVLSWAAVVGATSYDIYRSATSGGTYARLGSEPTVSSGSTTSYSDTGLTAGTTYYYKISALNLNGESAASSAVSGTTSGTAPNNQAGTTIAVPANTQPTQQPTTATETKKTGETAAEVKAPVSAEETASAQTGERPAEEKPLPKPSIAEKIVKTLVEVKKPLAVGAKGAAAKTVQEVLKSEGILVKVTGVFDKATKEAVKKFQLQNDILKKGDKNLGKLTAKTLTAINDIVKEEKNIVAEAARAAALTKKAALAAEKAAKVVARAAAKKAAAEKKAALAAEKAKARAEAAAKKAEEKAAQEAAKKVATEEKVALPTLLTKSLSKGARGAEVESLQQILHTEGLLDTPSGIYDASTVEAVQKFQEKYAIRKKGQVGYGRLGAETRSAINKMLK
ncbi:Ig-like domain-containing protein, partial [Candidatus Uhrbacteria bacterium]|nr:Ig-like domain-containing protein [Candidatus Uhrbacteria bacterium]